MINKLRANRAACTPKAMKKVLFVFLFVLVVLKLPSLTAAGFPESIEDQ
jgi:hypothetical protein